MLTAGARSGRGARYSNRGEGAVGQVLGRARSLANGSAVGSIRCDLRLGDHDVSAAETSALIAGGPTHDKTRATLNLVPAAPVTTDPLEADWRQELPNRRSELTDRLG